MEIEQKDFGKARDLADGIRTNAQNIMDIFNGIDSTMNSLYGNNWESAGANEALGRYNEIRSNYDTFYENVLKMNKHVHKVTDTSQEADPQASQKVVSV